MMQHKKDASQLATGEGWLAVLKEEVQSFEDDRAAMKLIRVENGRLGTLVQERHQLWLQARRDLNQKVHDTAFQKVNGFLTLGQVVIFGFAISCLKR